MWKMRMLFERPFLQEGHIFSVSLEALGSEEVKVEKETRVKFLRLKHGLRWDCRGKE